MARLVASRCATASCIRRPMSEYASHHPTPHQLTEAAKSVRKMLKPNTDAKHEVIEISKSGKVKRYVCSDHDVLNKVKDKSLHFRDLSIIQQADLARRRTAIVVRKRTLVLRLFEIQAVIQSNSCMLFGAQKPFIEQTGQVLRKELATAQSFMPRVAEGERESMEAAAGADDGDSESTREAYKELIKTIEVLMHHDFEHMALEVVFKSSIDRLRHRTGQIRMFVDVVLRDLQPDDVESLRKALPLKQKVEALRSDVDAMASVLSETLAQDEDMANMNLTWIDKNEGARPDVDDHLEVEAILETARRDVQEIGRILGETNERIDDTREVLNLSLDSQRNTILNLNLQVSLFTLALTAIAVPAGILGMNIPLGLEENAAAMPFVLAGMSVLGSIMYALPMGYFYYMHKISSKARRDEVVALQQLVHDMDVVEQTFYRLASKVRLAALVPRALGVCVWHGKV